MSNVLVFPSFSMKGITISFYFVYALVYLSRN
jgi:hypothetical protein